MINLVVEQVSVTNRVPVIDNDGKMVPALRRVLCVGDRLMGRFEMLVGGRRVQTHALRRMLYRTKAATLLLHRLMC